MLPPCFQALHLTLSLEWAVGRSTVTRRDPFSRVGEGATCYGTVKLTTGRWDGCFYPAKVTPLEPNILTLGPATLRLPLHAFGNHSKQHAHAPSHHHHQHNRWLVLLRLLPNPPLNGQLTPGVRAQASGFTPAISYHCMQGVPLLQYAHEHSPDRAEPQPYA